MGENPKWEGMCDPMRELLEDKVLMDWGPVSSELEDKGLNSEESGQNVSMESVVSIDDVEWEEIMDKYESVPMDIDVTLVKREKPKLSRACTKYSYGTKTAQHQTKIKFNFSKAKPKPKKGTIIKYLSTHKQDHSGRLTLETSHYGPTDALVSNTPNNPPGPHSGNASQAQLSNPETFNYHQLSDN